MTTATKAPTKATKAPNVSAALIAPLPKATKAPTKPPTKPPTDIQHSLRPMLQELERVYLATAQHVRGGFRLQKTHPLITVQTRGLRKNSNGHCAPKQWRHGKTDVTEISISAEALTRPLLAVLSTLVHEMAHHANGLGDVEDCSKGGRHNKKFRDTAESFGLIVAPPYDSRGYAYTTPGPELETFLEGLHVNQDAFDYARHVVKSLPKTETRMKKWSCGCTTVRAVSLDAECLGCSNTFVEAKATVKVVV